jgi:hypothetical protein
LSPHSRIATPSISFCHSSQILRETTVPRNKSSTSSLCINQTEIQSSASNLRINTSTFGSYTNRNIRAYGSSSRY